MTSTELTIIEGRPGYVIPAESFTQDGGLTSILDRIAADVRAIPTDISTEKGRKAIASLAYKVARSKTAIDDTGKALVEEVKRKTASIDAERRKAREFLDALKDEVRRPLDEFEAREKARIQAHEDALLAISEHQGFGHTETADELAQRLEYLNNYPPRDWQEFRSRFEITLRTEIARTTALHAAAVKREAEAAELERLRAEAAEREAREAEERRKREQHERDLRIAEAARLEAEQRAREEAERERRAAAEREAALIRQQQEAEQAAAEAKERADREERARQEAAQREREQAEQRRIDAHRRALASVKGMFADATSPFNASGLIRHISGMIDGMEELKRDWEEFRGEFDAIMQDGRKRVADRLAYVEAQEAQSRQKALEAAEQARIAAEEAAAQRERDRIEAERQAAAEEQRRREQDRAHRAKINTEAMNGLIAAGLSEAAAKTAVTAIAKGEIPNVRISY